MTVAVTRRPDGQVVVAVTDRGPGMTRSEAQTVMKPFERLARSADISSEGGLGLGLPTAEAFAKLHGAELEILSEVGQGTTVSVTFPADIHFRQLLLTGPPGAGKSTLIRKLGGWSEEGYIDLSLNSASERLHARDSRYPQAGNRTAPGFLRPAQPAVARPSRRSLIR